MERGIFTSYWCLCITQVVKPGTKASVEVDEVDDLSQLE